jgi:BolA protein|tara:strand:- start:3578 stop:3886 length:309 start_codon:yes stop_codon:yes gene_type:complete
MALHQVIQDKLNNHLVPSFLTIENESHKHSVPVDSETHFKVVVVSGCFENKPLVQRHQIIYGLLAHELQSGLHALALHTYTPAEWLIVAHPPTSPDCMGGAK